MPKGALMNGGRPPLAAADLSRKIAGLAERDTVELRCEWRRLYRSIPPARIRRDLLVLAITWKLQERVYGGLTAAQKRKLAGLAEALRTNGDLAGSPAIRVKPGMRLMREWRGTTHTVLVLEEGFEWNGEHRRSLSAIAREITGAKWSGPRFFGLQRKSKPSSGEEQADA